MHKVLHWIWHLAVNAEFQDALRGCVGLSQSLGAVELCV